MTRLAVSCGSSMGVDPAFADIPIVRERRDVQLNTVLSNSFGFGGTNASVVFKRLDA